MCLCGLKISANTSVLRKQTRFINVPTQGQLQEQEQLQNSTFVIHHSSFKTPVTPL